MKLAHELLIRADDLEDFVFLRMLLSSTKRLGNVEKTGVHKQLIVQHPIRILKGYISLAPKTETSPGVDSSAPRAHTAGRIIADIPPFVILPNMIPNLQLELQLDTGRSQSLLA